MIAISTFKISLVTPKDKTPMSRVLIFKLSGNYPSCFSTIFCKTNSKEKDSLTSNPKVSKKNKSK